MPRISQTEAQRYLTPYPSAETLARVGNNVIVKAEGSFWGNPRNQELVPEVYNHRMMALANYLSDELQIERTEAKVALAVIEELAIARHSTKEVGSGQGN